MLSLCLDLDSAQTLGILHSGDSRLKLLAVLLQPQCPPTHEYPTHPSPPQVMAIGDGENDMAMLNSCGLAVAMGDAHPRLKTIAHDVVGTNDEGGWAAAVSKYVLIPQGAEPIEVASGT